MLKRMIDIMIAAAFGGVAGCAPLSSQVAPSPGTMIVEWRLVNRPYEELEKLQLAGDARIPPLLSALVFEPIYSGDETECDPSEFIRIEVIAGEKAHVGEFVTARISIPNADEDALHLVEIRATNGSTQLEGPNRFILHGLEVKTIRFTSKLEGRGGIRVSALRSPQ